MSEDNEVKVVIRGVSILLTLRTCVIIEGYLGKKITFFQNRFFKEHDPNAVTIGGGKKIGDTRSLYRYVRASKPEFEFTDLRPLMDKIDISINKLVKKLGYGTISDVYSWTRPHTFDREMVTFNFVKDNLPFLVEDFLSNKE